MGKYAFLREKEIGIKTHVENQSIFPQVFHRWEGAK